MLWGHFAVCFPHSVQATINKSFPISVQTAASKGQRLLNPSNFDGRAPDEKTTPPLEVLMIPLGDQREPLGLDMEDKFMDLLKPVHSKRHKSVDGSEKRARFVDSESIGWTI
jgi:hypothetical protein